MNFLQVFIFSILCILSYASDREPRSGYPTECCICDDHSPDQTKRCSYPGVCSRSFKLCTEYCHTTRRFHSGKWKTVRGCATQLTCIDQWYHTITTLGCIDNTRGEPASGTECYSCCRTPSPLKPHYCQEDPDTHFIRFNITTLPPTTPSTTTTTSTTQTTPTTTTQTTTTTIPTTTQTPGALCEVCTSNCTNPQTVSCPHGEDLCMTTVTTRDNGETSIKKECSTETQCYYDAYVFMKNVTDCQQAKQSGTFNKKGICHYCCKPGTGNQACNRGVIPQNIYTYENPNATHCMVGRDGSYTRTECKAATPSCMNTVIRSNGVTIVKKSCEDEIICDTDWWRNSRTRPECRSTDYQALNQSLQNTGVVCHYCCTSKNGSTCNTDDIPKDSMSKFKVDGSWGAWQTWNGCSPTCQGTRIRIRTCSNPYPANGGSICQGSGFQQELCPQNCHGPGIAIVG